MQSKTIFEKIIDGEIPADFLYQDDDCIVINDINPQAKIHVLVIPKKRIPMLSQAEQADRMLLGKLMLVAAHMAEKLGIGDAFKLLVNNGEEAGMTVPHLHLHVVSKDLRWAHG